MKPGLDAPAPAHTESPARQAPLPLQAGDRLGRAEFERRYAAMPDLKKAELIEGVVYVPSPVNHRSHGQPHMQMAAWIAAYTARTPGTEGSDNATVRLDQDNEPQPDLLLRIEPDRGGQSRTGAEGFIEGAPELIAEVAASSSSYDLHQKLQAYRRNGVLEYVVRRTLEGGLDWFVLEEGEYRRIEPDAAGLLRSRAFPGLWLDAAALLRGDLVSVLAVLEEGCRSPEHAALVDRLRPGRTS